MDLFIYTLWKMGTQKNTYAILFKKKRLRELRLKIFPHCRIHQIVPVLNAISFHPHLHRKDHVSYALLELINNSLRAHQERGIQDPIVVRLQGGGSNLQIEIKDKGGGFDPQKLPYNLFDKNIPENMNADPFLQYRRIHENKRFGMGLLIAKRVFPHFTLRFVDGEGRPRPWGDPSIVGTHIIAELEQFDTENIPESEAGTKYGSK